MGFGANKYYDILSAQVLVCVLANTWSFTLGGIGGIWGTGIGTGTTAEVCTIFVVLLAKG